MADRSSKVGLMNTNEIPINPATEDKQDSIITAINNISGLQRSTNMFGVGRTAVGTTAVEVAITGTPEAIIVQADRLNSGVLYVGKSDVTNAGANAICQLEAGDAVEIAYDDTTNAVYVVSDTADQYFIAGALI